MALVSPEGVYLRIRKIDLIPGDASAIRFWLYRNQQTRENGPGPFDHTQEGDVRGSDVTDALFISQPGDGLGAADALISAAYSHLKTLDDFASWQNA